jgi:splicing factor 3A subunit 3
MRSLGIPNTKHFHGITSIDDAQQLWDSLQGKLQHEQFDNAQEEEYEDSNGNVLSRTAYEELARQGRL